MPNIQLTDNLGLDVNVKTDALSSLAKYAQNLSKISLTNLDLKSLVDLTLADPSITSAHAGLNFADPVDIGSGAATLTLNAGLSGSMDIYVPPKDGGTLFESDLYGETIAVSATERYVSIALNASAGAGISATINQLCFGFQAGAKVTLANYRKFETTPAAPTILEAVETTVAGFSIPGSLDDLGAMPVDSIVTLNGAGAITFSATANLFTAANPLATLQLPSPAPALDVSAGGSVTVAATCTLEWDYELRVRKLDAARVSLGFYRRRGSETSVSVDVSAGISAGTSDTDLFSRLIAVVSKSAAADPSAMKTLGMPDEQRDAIAGAVKNAAQRKLEVSVSACLTSGDARSAAFLYEFDLGALDASGKSALAAALRGDLSALTGDGLPAGVAMVRSITTDVTKAGMTWRVNLLGIYNYISVVELARQGTVLYEPVTGDLTITDKATAQRVAASTVNFGADTDKLRKVLAESFLITAVYRGSKSLISSEEIECSHSWFQLESSPGAAAMRKDLAAGTALGVLAAGDPDTLAAGVENFGRTMVYAETSYSAAITPFLFLNGADAKAVDEYDRAGRAAIRLLAPPDADDAFRLRGVSDDGLWAQMRDKGQFNFQPLFPDLTAGEVQAIATDYTVIVWWSKAMSDCANSVARMHALLALNPDPESAAFQSARKDLAKKLADITSNTKDEFGQPWGLVAMDQVSGRRASARMQVSGPHLALARTRGEAPAGATG